MAAHNDVSAMIEPTHEEQVAALWEAISLLEYRAAASINSPPTHNKRNAQAAALRAVLARLEADQWRPIEEAPQIYGSGTDVPAPRSTLRRPKGE